jgi:hypothetical protein
MNETIPPRLPDPPVHYRVDRLFGRDTHLRQSLRAYADYYNRIRTHLSLEKDAPLGRPVQAIGSLAAVPLLGGLHHEYVRMA